MATVGLLFLGILGALAGRAARQAVPWLLGLRDRQLPFSWPWLEALGAIAFLAVGMRLGLSEKTIGYFALVMVLLAIVATDYRAKLIPDRLSLGGVVLGVGWAAWSPSRLLDAPLNRLLLDAMGLGSDHLLAGPVLALVGAAAGFLVLEVIRIVFGLASGTEVMGMGDSKLLAMIGAWLGPFGALGTMLLGFLLGVVHGVLFLRFAKTPHSPFGPPLAAAAVAVLVAREPLLEALSGFQSRVLALPTTVLAGAYTLLVAIAVLLMLRTRRRAAAYEEMLEEDYRQLEDEMHDL